MFWEAIDWLIDSDETGGEFQDFDETTIQT